MLTWKCRCDRRSKSSKLLLVFAVLLLVSAGLAQDISPPAETVLDRVLKADRAMMSMAYRHTRVVEGSIDGAPPKVALEDVYIRDPQTGAHSIKRQHTPEGIVTSEIVTLFSGKTYRKQGDGPWELDAMRPSVPSGKSDPVKAPAASIPKSSLEVAVRPGNPSPARVPDKPRDVLIADEPGSYPDKTAPTKSPRRIKDGKCEPERLNGRPSVRCEMTRISGADSNWFETYWFDENGLVLKSVTKISRTTGHSTVVGITTISYEYDPTIKIEAPIKE